MLKRVEEDWSYFNRAVREKAEDKPRQEVPSLKLVTLEPPPAPNKVAPPTSPPPPSQPAPVTTAAPPSPSRPRPLSGGWVFDPIIKLLLGIVAIILLIALLEAASRNAHSTNPAVTGAKPGVAASGTAGAGGAEKVVTDYTMFNTVTYRSWKVVSGWKFADSRATPPSHQYCYLEVPKTGGQQAYSIEERVPVERHDMPEALIPGLDKAAWDEAATKCLWHH